MTDANLAAQILRERKYRFISSGVVAIAASEQATIKSFVVRDPDGHAMQLNER